jgi:parallel beta-helix repeat protein
MPSLSIHPLAPHRVRATLLFACAACLCALMPRARAHEFCVSTASELESALADSSDGGMYAGENNDIGLLPGTYVTGTGPFYYSNTTHGLSIIGGYDAGCVNRLDDPTLSVLDGANATAVLELHSLGGALEVDWLTIQNGESTGAGAGLYLEGMGGQITSVNNTIIRNNHAVDTAGGIYATVGSTGSDDVLFVESSLIVGNSADNGSSAGILIVHGAGATVAGNTVSTNSTTLPQGIGGLVFSGNDTCNCAVMNNIVWDNTAIGLWLGNANVALEYNDIGTPGGSPADTDIGNVSIAPQFVDRNGGDFHLAGDSPLFGLSPDPIGNLDLDGHSRPRFGRADPGAYEETIFADGFDGD